MKRGVLLAAVALSACSANPGGVDADDRAQTEAIELYRNGVKEVADIEKDVRIENLQRRVAQLEREILEMKADPAEVDVELLTQRLAALEARADAVPVSPAVPAEPAGRQRAQANDPQAPDTVRKAMEQKRAAER